MEKQAEYNVTLTAEQWQEFISQNPRAAEELLTTAMQNVNRRMEEMSELQYYARAVLPSYREAARNQKGIQELALQAFGAHQKQQQEAAIAEVKQPMPGRGLTEPEKAMLEHLDAHGRTHEGEQPAELVATRRILHRDAKVHADDFERIAGGLHDRGYIRNVEGPDWERRYLQITDKGRDALGDRKNDIPHKLRTVPLNQRELAVLMAMPDKGSGIGITDLTKASARKAEKLGFEHTGENTISIAEELKKNGLVGSQGLQYFRSPFGDAYLQKIQNQQLKSRHADIERSR